MWYLKHLPLCCGCVWCEWDQARSPRVCIKKQTIKHSIHVTAQSYCRRYLISSITLHQRDLPSIDLQIFCLTFSSIYKIITLIYLRRSICFRFHPRPNKFVQHFALHLSLTHTHTTNTHTHIKSSMPRCMHTHTLQLQPEHYRIIRFI